jgi:hypothetical protein
MSSLTPVDEFKYIDGFNYDDACFCLFWEELSNLLLDQLLFEQLSADDELPLPAEEELDELFMQSSLLSIFINY